MINYVISKNVKIWIIQTDFINLKKIIWISSYPKSGNTYVRAFLSHYLFSKNSKLDFNLLKKIPKFEKKGTFSKVLNENLLDDNYNFIEKSLHIQKTLIKKISSNSIPSYY